MYKSEPAELHLGGVQLARGYRNRLKQTLETFVPNGGAFGRQYKTGDLARCVSGPELQCLGRIDFQVKLRGLRIELGEIESVLLSTPHVLNFVAIVSKDQLVAYATPASASIEAMYAGAVLRLTSYMVPVAIMALDALPYTLNGKVDRKALPAVVGTLEIDGPAALKKRSAALKKLSGCDSA